MNEKISTYKFNDFGSAFAFWQSSVKKSIHGILFPRGGDNPRKLVTDPVTYLVILLLEEV